MSNALVFGEDRRCVELLALHAKVRVVSRAQHGGVDISFKAQRDRDFANLGVLALAKGKGGGDRFFVLLQFDSKRAHGCGLQFWKIPAQVEKRGERAFFLTMKLNLRRVGGRCLAEHLKLESAQDIFDPHAAGQRRLRAAQLAVAVQVKALHQEFGALIGGFEKIDQNFNTVGRNLGNDLSLLREHMRLGAAGAKQQGEDCGKKDREKKKVRLPKID